MKTIYYLTQDVPMLTQLGIQNQIPQIPWNEGEPDGVMMSVEFVLNDPQIAQLCQFMPTLVKGIKPGTRHGSPT